MRLPTFKELRRFVEIEGWENKDKLSKKKTGDHFRYLFTTPMGDRLYTRISHGVGQINSRELFAAILREQLQIDEKQFWNAVDKKVKPTRPTLAPDRSAGVLDGKLARNLITKVGMKPESLVEISSEEAVSIWEKWLSSQDSIEDS